MLAGTALAPAAAQVLDLGGAPVARGNFTGYTTVTNGELQFTPPAGGTVYSGGLDDSAGQLSLVKLGSGSLTLTGSGLNTYSGNTTLSLGKLVAGAANVASAQSLLNTGTSGVFDLAGYDQTINGLAGTGASSGVRNTGSLATLTIASDVDHIFGGNIGGNTGAGDAIRVIKTGSGIQTFNRISTYTGGTKLAAGGLAFGNGASFGTGTIDVTGAASLSTTGNGQTLANNVDLGAELTISGSRFAIAGIVSGTGGIDLSGGQLILANGANSFSGGLTLNGSEINFGSGSALGTGNITATTNVSQIVSTGTGVVVSNNFALSFGGTNTGLNITSPVAGDTLTFDGVFSGTGRIFLQGGDGTVIFNSANTLVGRFDVQNGYLGVGNSGALGGGAALINSSGPSGITAFAADLTLANNIRTRSVFKFDTNGYDLTQTGTIADFQSVAGSLVKAGTGTLTLVGAKTYTGTTTVEAGTLRLLGSLTSNVSVAAGATLSGTGTIGAGNTTFVQAGIIAPGVASGSVGTLTTGNLVLTSSSVLNFDLATPTSLTPPGSEAANDLIVVTSNLALDGTININALLGFGVGTYRVINYGNLSADNILLAGTGPNIYTYTIATTTGLNGGAGGVDLLVAFLPPPPPPVGALNWDGGGPYANGIVNGGNGTWSSAATNWTDASGTPVVAWGSTVGVFGGLVGGVVTVVGAQAFTELDFVANNYTLTGGALASVGGILNVSSGLAATIDSTITGTGLIKSGAGTLVLNAANSYVGGTSLTAGTIVAGNNLSLGAGAISMAGDTKLAAGISGLALANAITTSGVGTIDTGAGLLTLNGIVSGAGSISKTGAGNLALNGANSFNGLTVSAGQVTIGTSTAAGAGSIVLAGGSTLAAGVSGLVTTNAIGTTGVGTIDAGAGVLTLNGIVSGVGSIAKVGAGNLTLNGNNSFNGLNIVAGKATLGASTAGGVGIVTLNAGTTLAAGGNMTLANAIVAAGAGTIDTAANTLILAGVISGSGGITKQGSGGLVINAINAITGPTTVAGGLLSVNGSLANSATTVQNGASLAGSGRVGALSVQAGGSVAPGNAGVGTLTVNGSVNLAAGSVYKVEVNGLAADRITASGTSTIAGNLVVTNINAPGTTFNATYTLLSSSARTGTFSSASLGDYGVAFLPTLVYTSTSVLLQLAPNSLVAIGGNLTGNPLAVATGFDTAVRNGYNPQPFFALYTQGANLSNALGQLSGELHSAERRTLLEDTRAIREAAFDRLNAGFSALSGGQAVTRTDGDKATTFWLRAAGSWGTAKADAVGSRYQTEQRGVLTGIDFEQNGAKAGAMFHYTHTDLDFTALGNSKVETTGGTVYAGYRQPGQGFALGLGGTIASSTSKGSRTITVPGLQQTLVSEIGGTTYQVFGEAAYDLIPGDAVRAEPFARLAHIQVHSDPFAETGGIAALVGSAQSNELTVFDLGARGAVQTGIVQLSASAAWHRSSGDLAGLTYSSITGLNSQAGIRSVAIDRDAVAVEAQASFTLTPAIRLGAGYSGVIGSRNSDHGARATLTVGF